MRLAFIFSMRQYLPIANPRQPTLVRCEQKYEPSTWDAWVTCIEQQAANVEPGGNALCDVGIANIDRGG